MRKNFKTDIIYVLILILILSTLSGCGNSSGTTENSSQGFEQKLTETETSTTGESGSEEASVSEKNSSLEMESQTSNTSQTESESESQKPTPEPSEAEPESQKPTPTPTPEPSESESESQKPAPKPSESESESQKPAPKPSESESESQKPTPTPAPNPTPTPEPSESEEPEDSPSSTPEAEGWDKVPDFSKQNLSDEEMAQIVVDCIIDSGMSDFEKAISIHDWLTFNIDYDFTYTHFYPEETFRDRTGVCQGYALCFEMMCKEAGLEVNYVTGVGVNSAGETESHAWNQVKIDGTWYNVDVTWDDPANGAGKDPEDHSGNRYDYFLISKAEMEKDHAADNYKNGEKTCSKNYDRVAILSYAMNSGVHGDAAFATTQADANTAIEKFVNANKSSFWLWVYDTSMTSSNMWTKFAELTSSSKYPASTTTGYPPEDGIAKFLVTVTPSSEWNKIAVVTNVDEFVALLNKNGDAGITSYTVRYETTDGNIELAASSKYGFSYYDTVYAGGKSKLITVIIN